MANLPLYVALFRDECSLYMDMSGDSLHKRGYRTAMHTSSLNEAAAAGVLSLASWPEALSQGKAAAAVVMQVLVMAHVGCMPFASCWLPARSMHSVFYGPLWAPVLWDLL